MAKHTDSPETQEEQWRRATRLVRGGTRRSAHGETSEAMFLTSGYVYEDAGEAEARFKGDAPGFVYSRFGNPTVAMFERRLALLEGAEACKATSTGMAAVFASLMAQLRAGALDSPRAATSQQVAMAKASPALHQWRRKKHHLRGSVVIMLITLIYLNDI